MALYRNAVETTALPSIVLIRLAVGAVILSEGIQKFLFPGELGVGRFVKIGIPAPSVMAPFVGILEIGCGILMLIGLLTRLAAIPMIIRERPVGSASQILKDCYWRSTSTHRAA